MNSKFRHELKYLITHKEYVILKNRLKSLIKLDSNSLTEDGYHIRSLYFDDIYDSAFYEKEAGVNCRKKYRIRIYNKSDKEIKLEKKEKVNEYVSKKTVNISKNEYLAILNNQLQSSIVSNELLQEVYLESKIRQLRPKVIVDYLREAYILSTGNVRITFDKYLQAGINSFDIFSNNIINVNALENNLIILEIKYDNYYPTLIRNIVQISNFDYCSVSKYVICRKTKNNIQWRDRI